jgi:hypothetical protein
LIVQIIDYRNQAFSPACAISAPDEPDHREGDGAFCRRETYPQTIDSNFAAKFDCACRGCSDAFHMGAQNGLLLKVWVWAYALIM